MAAKRRQCSVCRCVLYEDEKRHCKDCGGIMRALSQREGSSRVMPGHEERMRGHAERVAREGEGQ